MPTTVARAAGWRSPSAVQGIRATQHTGQYSLHRPVRAGQHERKAARAGVPVEKLYADMAKDIPLGRVGRAEEVAKVIAFLASARPAS